MTLLNKFNKYVNKAFQNNNFVLIISVIIVLYAGFTAPALPDSVIILFDTIIGKIVLLFLIGYVASKNVQVALLIAVAFVITLQVANMRFLERYTNKYELFINKKKENNDKNCSCCKYCNCNNEGSKSFNPKSVEEYETY